MRDRPDDAMQAAIDLIREADYTNADPNSLARDVWQALDAIAQEVRRLRFRAAL